MKALLAVGIFVMLAGIGLLWLSHTGINTTSETNIRTFRRVKSHARSRIHTPFPAAPGWIALGGGMICAGIGIWGMKKEKG